MKKIFFTVGFLLLYLASTQAQTKNYINIQRGTYQRIKTHVQWNNTVPRYLIKLVKKNLLWSGVFELTKQKYSSINIEIVSGINNYFIVKFFSKKGEFLFRQTLEQTKNKTQQEKKVIEFIQKSVIQLTNKPSTLGSAIVYAEQTKNFAKKIIMIDTHNNKRIMLVNNQDYNILPKWSPAENSLIYTAIGRLGSRIIYIDLKKKTRRVFIRSRLGIATGGSWNINNSDLAVTLSNRVNHDIYIFRKNGSFKKQLTSLSAIDTSPSFSPDGNNLVFISNRSGSVQLYNLNLKTNKKKRISFTGSYNANPDWNNDGTHLLYAGRKNKIFQIYLMDFYSKQIKQLTYSKKTSEDPTWSPDDRLILFSSKISGESKLYVMSIDGKYIRRLTNSPKGIKETNPDWATDTPWKYFR